MDTMKKCGVWMKKIMLLLIGLLFIVFAITACDGNNKSQQMDTTSNHIAIPLPILEPTQDTENTGPVTDTKILEEQTPAVQVMTEDEAVKLIQSKLSEETLRISYVNSDGIDEQGNFRIRQASRATTVVMEWYHVNPSTQEITCEFLEGNCLEEDNEVIEVKLTIRQLEAIQIAKQYAREYYPHESGYVDGITYVTYANETKEGNIVIWIYNPGPGTTDTVDWLTIDANNTKVIKSERNYTTREADSNSEHWENLSKGTYLLNGSNKYGQSHLTIENIADQSITISIDAFAVTGGDEGIRNGSIHVGNLDSIIAEFSGDQMIYKNGNHVISLSITSPTEITISDNGEGGHYGMNITVNGTYTLSTVEEIHSATSKPVPEIENAYLVLDQFTQALQDKNISLLATMLNGNNGNVFDASDIKKMIEKFEHLFDLSTVKMIYHAEHLYPTTYSFIMRGFDNNQILKEDYIFVVIDEEEGITVSSSFIYVSLYIESDFTDYFNGIVNNDPQLVAQTLSYEDHVYPDEVGSKVIENYHTYFSDDDLSIQYIGYYSDIYDANGDYYLIEISSSSKHHQFKLIPWGGFLSFEDDFIPEYE